MSTSEFSRLIRRFLKGLIAKRSVSEEPSPRKAVIDGDVPEDRFISILLLMIVFFAGLIALQVTYMIVFHEWSETIFNGIMLIVGTIVGAVWGRSG